MSLSGHNKSELAPAGRRAMQAFYNAAKQYPAMELSFDELLNWCAVDDGRGDPNYTFLANMGDSALIVADKYGWDYVESKMADLANDSEGRLPTFPDGGPDQQEFFQAMVSAVSTANWRTLSRDTYAVISGTAAEVAKDAKIVGGLALGGLSLYYLLGGAIGLFALYEAARKK